MTAPYPHHHWTLPPGDPGAPSAIDLNLRSSRLLFLGAKPSIHLDGHVFPGTWGRHVFPVAPGQHHLHIHLAHRLLGPADLTVVVPPGRTVELEYAGPAVSMLHGALGPPPQRHPGLRGVIASYVVCGAGFLAVLSYLAFHSFG